MIFSRFFEVTVTLLPSKYQQSLEATPQSTQNGCSILFQCLEPRLITNCHSATMPMALHNNRVTEFFTLYTLTPTYSIKSTYVARSYSSLEPQIMAQARI